MCVADLPKHRPRSDSCRQSDLAMGENGVLPEGATGSMHMLRSLIATELEAAINTAAIQFCGREHFWNVPEAGQAAKEQFWTTLPEKDHLKGRVF